MTLNVFYINFCKPVTRRYFYILAFKKLDFIELSNLKKNNTLYKHNTQGFANLEQHKDIKNNTYQTIKKGKLLWNPKQKHQSQLKMGKCMKLKAKMVSQYVLLFLKI